MKQGSSRGLDPEVVAELDRQYKAMEQSLKAYVDQRIAARGEVAAPAPALPKEWLVAGVLALALACAGLWWWFFREPADDVRAVASIEVPATVAVTEPVATEEPAPPPPDPLREAIASGAADGQWAVSLKNLMEQHGRLVAAVMREADANALGDLAQRLEAGQPLTQAQRARARVLLLESIAAVKVDGNLRDVTPQLLSQLRATYSVTSRSNDRTNIDLQSEIILRWMEADAR